MKTIAWLAGIALAAALGTAAFVWSGWYDISATAQHTQPVHTLLEYTMQRSVRLRAAAIAVPASLGDTALVARGALCYREKCLQCHGGPGVAQHDIGRSMQPLPGPLVDASARWRPQELYWLTRHGIKMSGMPAWQHRVSDADLWAMVAFMQRLPQLTAAGFRGMVEAQPDAQCNAAETDLASATASLPVADAERGRAAITQYACSACHRVPGVTGAAVDVGPPLAGLASRQSIAGRVPNTPEQMVRWLRDPRSIDPQTTMPDMQVGERDARDIAAYLATLH